MNPTEWRELIARAPLPLILALILFYAADTITGPADFARQQADQELRSHTQSVRAARDQRDRQLRLHRLQDRLVNETSRLESWLPVRSELPKLVDGLQDLARSLGVTIQVCRYQRPRVLSADDRVTEHYLQLELELAAEFPALSAFVRALEAMPHPVIPIELAARQQRQYSLRILQPFRPQ